MGHLLRSILALGALFIVTAADDRIRYDNYQLFELTPTTADQRQYLRKLQLTSDSHIFLHSAPEANSQWLVVVAPHKHTEFRDYLRQEGIPSRTVLPDLQTAIDAEAHLTARTTQFGWTAYHTLDSIYTWLDQLITEYPQQVQDLQIGRSYENRTIRGVKVSFGAADDPAKPGVFIEGGIHAREWISPAFCTYLINELLTSQDPAVRQVAESHDWYVVPSVNPDGYVHTHTKDRLWRKTRTPHGLLCRGADPNRNWDFHWAEASTSPFPCSDIYPGPEAFSEVEMRDYERFLRDLSGKLHTFVAFHSYSQLLLYPYGHSSEATANAADLQQIGAVAVAALSRRYGTRYRVGSVYETIYPASGASVDYVHAKLGIPVAFTYELRPANGRRTGFELPAEQIVPVGEETMDSLVALLQEATRLGYNRVEGESDLE